MCCLLVFSCVFVTFPYGALGQVRYLIVSIPDLCILPDFYEPSIKFQCIQTYGSRDVENVKSLRPT